MAGVSLHTLHKRYDSGFHAVRGISLEIADGEFLVLVGPSGCGKSTTLRMIAGLEAVSEGEIRIGGRLVNDVAPGDRDIAMVFQNYALYPHLTVRDNMAFGLRMRGTPKPDIDRRVTAAAESLAIEGLLSRRPRELSGGQRQRVALGRAIVREPAVFLFDEPLSNLDAKLRVQMRAELARLHRRLGTTVIYVTHDQVEAMTLGDRIVLMNQGVIQQADSPLEIYRRPANRFVASFIGSPTMNFFPGRIEGDCFQLDGGELRLPLGAEATRFPTGPAVLGIRPEDFLLAAGGEVLATVPIDVVEHTGHETFAHFLLGGADQVVRLPGDVAVRPGDRLPLAVRPGGLHLFADDDAGRRLG
ncbi:MAG: sn-glycerol-3-phosphate import ATP-binding protein UgpC [Planctomycetota bacterium]|jgi:ABC-type sugar transport system ATPase subunit